MLGPRPELLTRSSWCHPHRNEQQPRSHSITAPCGFWSKATHAIDHRQPTTWQTKLPCTPNSRQVSANAHSGTRSSHHGAVWSASSVGKFVRHVGKNSRTRRAHRGGRRDGSCRALPLCRPRPSVDREVTGRQSLSRCNCRHVKATTLSAELCPSRIEPLLFVAVGWCGCWYQSVYKHRECRPLKPHHQRSIRGT